MIPARKKCVITPWKETCDVLMPVFSKGARRTQNTIRDKQAKKQHQSALRQDKKLTSVLIRVAWHAAGSHLGIRDENDVTRVQPILEPGCLIARESKN